MHVNTRQFEKELGKLRFDLSAPQLPENVRYVGPELEDPDWAAEAKWQRQGSEPLVLVAPSSIYQDRIEFLQRISNGSSTPSVRRISSA